MTNLKIKIEAWNYLKDDNENIDIEIWADDESICIKYNDRDLYIPKLILNALLKND